MLLSSARLRFDADVRSARVYDMAALSTSWSYAARFSVLVGEEFRAALRLELPE